jgi:hypothetical protein
MKKIIYVLTVILILVSCAGSPASGDSAAASTENAPAAPGRAAAGDSVAASTENAPAAPGRAAAGDSVAASTENAPAAPGRAAAVSVKNYFTGDGGKGMSLAILAPQAAGLAENQKYLPSLVQGELVSNFSGYSAISVLDRVNLDEQYGELLGGYYDDNAETGMDLGRLTPTEYIMGGSITKTATGYALQIRITKTADKMTAASYSGTCTFAELDNLTGIRQASLDLLQKMGVTLTESARTELAGAASTQAVSGQTALAKGITAQKSGTVVEAMSYYYEAVKFDPGLAEAASRGSVLSADISGGNIGENIRSEIERRNAWKKTIDEAAAFFKEHLPFEIIYNPALTQGRIDFAKETVELSFDALLISTTGFKIISDLQQGLEKASKSSPWGIHIDSIFTAMPRSLDIDAVLIDERGETIGRASGRFDYLYAGMNSITRSQFSQKKCTVTFQNVDANKISDALTVSIVSVNGIDAKAAGERGYIGISAENFILSDSGGSVRLTDSFRVTWLLGGINILGLGYPGTEKNLVIPSKISRWPVISLGENSFQRRGLTSVTIPDSVTAIGDFAFWQDQLTSVTIPNSVVSIGIGAFDGNSLVSITLPANVSFKAGSNADSMRSFYNENGKKAGTYRYTNGNWTYRP